MRTRSILACLLFAAAAGCGKSKTQTPATTTGPTLPEPQVTEQTREPTDTTSAWCPTQVAGTTVTVEDTAAGAALVFRTEGDVAEVRRRVVAMADATNAQQQEMQRAHEEQMEREMGGGAPEPAPGTTEPAPGTTVPSPGTAEPAPGTTEPGGEMGGEPGAGAAPGAEMEEPVTTTAVVVSTTDGARLEITTDPQNVEDVQMALRRDAAQMNTGTCEHPAIAPTPEGVDY